MLADTFYPLFYKGFKLVLIADLPKKGYFFYQGTTKNSKRVCTYHKPKEEKFFLKLSEYLCGISNSKKIFFNLYRNGFFNV